jgi:hypothetical protein
MVLSASLRAVKHLRRHRLGFPSTVVAACMPTNAAGNQERIRRAAGLETETGRRVRGGTVNGSRKLTHMRQLKTDPPPAGLVLGRLVGDAAEVSVFESVGVAFEGDDFGVVDEAVDHGGGDDVVAEDFAPAAEGLVGGDDQRGPLAA